MVNHCSVTGYTVAKTMIPSEWQTTSLWRRRIRAWWLDEWMEVVKEEW